MSAPYQYIVLHKSCKNSPGIAACQAAHAATECIQSLPVSDQTHVCVLEAETSIELETLGKVLHNEGIPHVVIREPDEPYRGAAVAVGVAPMDRDLIRPYMQTFKVFR